MKLTVSFLGGASLMVETPPHTFPKLDYGGLNMSGTENQTFTLTSEVFSY